MHYCRPQILSSSPCCNTRALISLSSKSSLQFSWPTRVIKVLNCIFQWIHTIITPSRPHGLIIQRYSSSQNPWNINAAARNRKPNSVETDPPLASSPQRLKSLGRQRYQHNRIRWVFIDEIDIMLIHCANLISCHFDFQPCMLELVLF